jgi:hypothetical protein
MQATDHPLQHWIPYRFVFENDRPLVQWLYVADMRFDDPFFDESIAACRSHTYNSSRYKSISSPESMIEWSYWTEELPVTFIFHVSRCGSTLLSQLISLSEKYTVLSEVPFFDEIVRLPYKIKGTDHKQIEELFKAAVKLVGKKRTGKEEQLFIKTDSWHIFFHNLLRRLYPAAPFILLYRSPDEVVHSHQKHRGMQAVPGLIEPGLFGFSSEVINEPDLDAYTARVLERYLLVFEELLHHNSNLLIDYKEGVMHMMTRIAAHLNIEWETGHVQQMQERSKFHSKYPQQNFAEETGAKQVPEYLKEAMMRYQSLGKYKQPV